MNTPKQWLPEKGVKGVGGDREGGINKGQEEIWGWGVACDGHVHHLIPGVVISHLKIKLHTLTKCRLSHINYSSIKL